MQFLYDNLIATVMGMTVLLILVVIQMRATRANVAQTSRAVAFNQAETLATWLEEDLGQMGRNMDSKPFTFSDRSDESGSPTEETLTDFEFDYKDEDGNLSTIQYTVRYADGESPPYELERSDGSGGGGSVGALGYFDLQFINKRAQTPPNTHPDIDKIQAVRVRFSVVLPFQNDETTLNEIHRMIVVPYPPTQN